MSLGVGLRTEVPLVEFDTTDVLSAVYDAFDATFVPDDAEIDASSLEKQRPEARPDVIAVDPSRSRLCDPPELFAKFGRESGCHRSAGLMREALSDADHIGRCTRGDDQPVRANFPSPAA